MTRNLAAILILLLSAYSASPQWYKRDAVHDVNSNGPFYTSFTCIYFSDSTNGWAVGTGGTILRYTGISNKWLPFASGTQSRVTGVHALNARHAMAVGDKGTILKFEDGYWKKLNYTGTTNFDGIFMLDSVTAWAVGGRELVKISGNTFTKYTPPTSDVWTDVYFQNPNLGWAIGIYGDVIKFTNGAWKRDRITNGNYDIEFADATTGYIAALGAIYKLVNGLWELEVGGADVRRQHTISAVPGFAMTCGIEGSAYQLNNGNWTRFAKAPGINDELSDLFFTSKTFGWGVNSGGQMYRWNNNRWNEYSLAYLDTITTVPYLDPIATVFATDKNNVWINGNYVNLPNNGDWSTQKFNDSAYFSTFFVDKNNGWSAGAYPLAKWQTDHWVDLFNYNGGAYPLYMDIHMFSGTDGWMVGLKDFNPTIQSGVIAHYNGTTFTDYAITLTNKLLYGIHFSDQVNGWAVGDAGTIVRYSNGQWSFVSSPTTNLLNDVHTLSANNAWSVGANGTLLKYDGNAWQKINSGTSLDLNAIWFSDPDHGWIVGNGGLILRYDGGAWVQDTVITTYDLYDVHFPDSTHGWVVGQGGTILQYTTEAVNIPAGQPIPNSAYPNPSPGSVTIKFSLPEQADVYLKIFNQFGRLVASLNLGNRAAGVHTYNYNGLGLQNGMYYYQIIAGDKKGQGESMIMH
jgi:photosystem II stability/assembly factor-like uncharacterized protein